MGNFREPFPPEHAREEGITPRQIERDVDTTLLDFSAMLAARPETPRLRRGLRALIVADLNKEKLLPAVFPGEFFQFRASLFPSLRNFGSGRVCGFREREISENTDVIERVPEFHVTVFVPVRAIGNFAVINGADCRDDFPPAFLKLLRMRKLKTDAKNFRVLRFSQCRHLDDPGFVIGKESVPFFGGDEVDVAAPGELRS